MTMSSLMDSIHQGAPELQEMVFDIEKAISLAVMIRAAWRLACWLAVKVVEAVLAERAQRPTPWPNCPNCKTPLRSKGFVSRQITSMIGVIHWKRRVGRCCQDCPIGQVAPLDDELGLSLHQHTSLELKQVACQFAIFVPFEIAAILLSQWLPVQVSPTAVWCWVQRVGRKAMEVVNHQLEELALDRPPPEEALDEVTAVLALLIGADGVMAPFRPDGGKPEGRTVWREVKVGILARLGQQTTRTGQVVARLRQRRLVAVLGDIDALSPRLWLEAVRQGIVHAKQVVWLSDGGRGFWQVYFARFAEYARGILDFYHAAQNVWKGAAAWLDGRSKQAGQWFALARHRLRHGEAKSVLADIKAAMKGPGLSDSARKTLVNLYGYLERHQDHINYKEFKELGLPIGSGLVESACKWLIQQRFKGVGMRWSEDGFNHLLHLRLAWVNKRFDALFPLKVSPNS